MDLTQCYGCKWAHWLSSPDSTEVHCECDPPMGECPAEFPHEEEG